jgi:lantibiotic biosynthesis protein
VRIGCHGQVLVNFEGLPQMRKAGLRLGAAQVTFADAFQHEARRYGGADAMAAAESLFCADSDSVADYIRPAPSEVQRLTMATRTIAAWWRHATGRDADLYPAMRAAQRVLWPGEGWPSKGVGRVWRAYQAEVTEEMRATGGPAHGEQEISALLGRASNGLSDKNVREIIASVAHMHCNRLFACDNRRMEALAYEFALREMMRTDAVSR